MEKNQQHYCIILAGGRGRRLWPCSRDKKPKQFIDFFGTGRTQLQSTFDRFSEILPQGNIYVCTNHEYAPMVLEQLPELRVENLMIESVNRNTTASVISATLNIHRRCANACIAVTPSDQFVLNDEAFRHNIAEAMETASNQPIALVLGVKPTRSEPGYGYIQMGEQSPHPDIYSVQSFTEKPEREFAQMFVDSGEFLWNTGLIVASADTLRRCVRRIYARHFSEALPEEHDYTIEWVMNFVENKYASLPNIPIDSGMLEMCDNVYVMQCDFGWADLGTWHSIYECMGHGEGDNVIINSEVIIEDSRNNVIKLPKDHLAVINGLDGYIVAEQGNVLLICKKSDSSALIRKYVNEVHIKYGDEFI
jgi:mannose-1-phosphate guanylyltransferase